MFRPVKTVLAAAMILGATALTGTAFAAAPMVKTQAPGYYRMMLGSFEVTAISHGTVGLPVTKLLNEKPAKSSAALRKAFLGETVETSVNAYLINTGSKLVLVDTGAAGLFGPTLGNLLANIKAAGYQPAQIDEIYITHMHPDHVGGLMAGSELAFPNATLRIDKADTDFWLSEAAYADAAKNGYLVGASHLSFPGLGHLRKASGGKGYIFVPVNYTSLK